MTAKTDLPPSSVAAFTEALKGERGSLDAWLEVNDEREVAAHVEAYARANVAHATAAKDAEIEALKSDLGDYMDAANYQATRAERLAEALRELRDLMLGQVKWTPCDCGCPQQRTPDGPHSVTWLRAAQQVEIAIGKAEAEDRG